VKIGRLALANDPFNTGYGYELYFTDNRVIGFSYRKIVSRAYRWAYLLCLTWAVLLTSIIAYDRLAGVSGDQAILPAVWGAPARRNHSWIGRPNPSLLSLHRASESASQIRCEAPTSKLGLENQSSDFMLERASISQVTIQDGRINILTKPGQRYSLIGRIAPRWYSKPLKWRGEPRQLF